MNNKVTVIISTKNEERNIRTCLESVRSQTYKNLEIIVVDNFSLDKTVSISKEYTQKVFKKGPERSSQRNYGASKATGTFLLFIDADMILEKDVIESCIHLISSDKNIKAIVIPEKSIGTSFWAKCKALERSFYEGLDWIEGARFFERKLFLQLGGYNTDLISGEDWDIHARFKEKGKIQRIKKYILHNEGKLTLQETVKTKYYYAKNIHLYKHLADSSRYSNQASVIKRYLLFFSDPQKLFNNPVVGVGMLFMKSSEYGAGLIGYVIGMLRSKN